ncbi:hypothetical protein PVZ95_19970 [Bordetella pertussis]|uniref:hypothetical protein n=1 Tax=Bordetella pertussis TaxID=520 RepID=UPI0028E3DEFA|nr:hypothetical protein [Bordetella pertussis]WNQ67572.1 hypothetical protein PVZ95_19970 [Bordetella pertussis]
MAQVLGGTLGGSLMAARHAARRRPDDPDDVGHFFLALDPDAFRAERLVRVRDDDLIDTLHDTPRPTRPSRCWCARRSGGGRARRGACAMACRWRRRCANGCGGSANASGAEYVLDAVEPAAHKSIHIPEEDETS